MNRFKDQFRESPMDEKRDLTKWLFTAYTSLENLNINNAEKALHGVESLLTSTVEVNEVLELISQREYWEAKDRVDRLIVIAISNMKPMIQ